MLVRSLLRNYLKMSSHQSKEKQATLWKTGCKLQLLTIISLLAKPLNRPVQKLVLVAFSIGMVEYIIPILRQSGTP